MQQWLLPGSLDLYVSQREKNNILVFDQVQHNPGCTATGAGKRLKFSDLVIVLAMWRKQRQRADQRLCFRTCKRFVCFSHDVAFMS